MDTETMIRELEKVEENHKDDRVFTGQLNIAEMAHDVRKRLKELKPYEDTDLTPQQIKDMQFCLREKSRECAELRMELQKLKNKKNDGWIPVEKELPPIGQRLQATILHHEWITDYDSAWVPDEEKSYHPEYTEVCEIYLIEGMWFYACGEDDYEKDVAYINPKKDLGNPISEIIAWRPMPEPYRTERRRKA